MQTVEVSREPTVDELVGAIHSIDYMLAHQKMPGLAQAADSLKVTGAILSLALQTQLVDEGKLPSMGVKMLVMPYSEVCMHMKIAGKRMWGHKTSLQPYSMIQLYTLGGQKYSMPITKGEAGWGMPDGN